MPCTEGLALSPSYIKAVFTGLITRIRAPASFVGALVQPESVWLSWPGLASIWQQQPTVHRGAPGSEQGPLLFRPLLLLSVMTFVRRRIGVEGLAYPRGERERERDGRGGDAKTCRQAGVWIMEI